MEKILKSQLEPQEVASIGVSYKLMSLLSAQNIIQPPTRSPFYKMSYLELAVGHFGLWPRIGARETDGGNISALFMAAPGWISGVMLAAFWHLAGGWVNWNILEY